MCGRIVRSAGLTQERFEGAATRYHASPASDLLLVLWRTGIGRHDPFPGTWRLHLRVLLEDRDSDARLRVAVYEGWHRRLLPNRRRERAVYRSSFRRARLQRKTDRFEYPVPWPPRAQATYTPLFPACCRGW